jgi:hypothetical protein
MSGNGFVTFGSAGNGTNQFGAPLTGQVFIDASGKIYVGDSCNNRVVRIDDMNGANWTVYSSFNSGSGTFSGPIGIAVR